ncbi:hypothetical protein [Streptomyces sp. enrichment culture]|uniref:hypothetical protein n=1 Tax=Streptomyces sp. enrichment culture TaxID=1795815 RepID=UPI003F549CD0
MPSPTPPTRKAELTADAWAEALAMTGTGPGRTPSSPGNLTAAALRAHRTLSAGLGQHIPFTALDQSGGARALATFLAVYAAQNEDTQERRDRPTTRQDLRTAA